MNIGKRSISRKRAQLNADRLASLALMVLLLAACTNYPESCPSYSTFNLSEADTFPSDGRLPFQFPVAGYDPGTPTHRSSFTASGRDKSNSPIEYHAAEDSFHPAGTPVYAMADGKISYSGPAGGYGWLVIIDHPQANLYSLYGHLSPSRWRIQSGTVKKGELIAYLGDSDENGGSAKRPLEPHLHFGIRTGQRADYPGKGEWRWMAGWIHLCPQDLGWLQPSVVISRQAIPEGRYTGPNPEVWVLWGSDLLITTLYAVGGAAILVNAIRKKWAVMLFFPGLIIIAAGLVLHNNGMIRTYTLLAIGIILLGIGVYWYFRRRQPQQA